MKYIISLIRYLFLFLFIFLLVNDKLMLWLILFGVSLLLALVFGRIYCGYVCPMNTLMIPVEKLSKKFKWQSSKTPQWLVSGNFGWYTLIGSVALFFFTRRILGKNFPILIIWLILSLLITLRYKPEVFHNLICPFGKLQQFFGKFAIFSEKVEHLGCIGCKKCERVCPSAAIVVDPISKKATIDTEYCLQCTNCQQVCPTQTISYTKR